MLINFHGFPSLPLLIILLPVSWPWNVSSWRQSYLSVWFTDKHQALQLFDECTNECPQKACKTRSDNSSQHRCFGLSSADSLRYKNNCKGIRVTSLCYLIIPMAQFTAPWLFLEPLKETKTFWLQLCAHPGYEE